MSALQLAKATEINRLHGLALDTANVAIDYAKRAGKLLLEVKASLPRGEFLPWLSAHVVVSVRQSQRYMRAAQGKTMPIRSIGKNDTVSHLPEWLPSTGMVAMVDFCPGDRLLVQERPDEPGYFWVFFLYGKEALWLKRGVRGDYVAYVVLGWLPGSYASAGLDRLPWETSGPHDDDPVGGMIRKLAISAELRI